MFYVSFSFDFNSVAVTDSKNGAGLETHIQPVKTIWPGVFCSGIVLPYAASYENI